ncbi:hypothetical protein BLNAU_12938 [Blattamonas nauphoetae]|uniref:Uncharacterized protein n=1 Tax=Blattamonas nauphoetae TaxID=2049346 RepID=A0ABQ9XI31_9EUKA|nr:hypothetical protein BLNAU_12938 [Blattamonas nauphoetae]
MEMNEWVTDQPITPEILNREQKREEQERSDLNRTKPGQINPRFNQKQLLQITVLIIEMELIQTQKTYALFCSLFARDTMTMVDLYLDGSLHL